MTDLHVHQRPTGELPPIDWDPPAERPLWSDGPGSLDETSEMAIARVVAADRTAVFTVPPELLSGSATAEAPRPRSADQFWGWAVWAGATAALLLVVVAWLGTEGRGSVDEAPTTETTDVQAATEGTPAPMVADGRDAAVQTAVTTPDTSPDTTPDTTPTTAEPAGQVEDPFPPGFPFEDR